MKLKEYTAKLPRGGCGKLAEKLGISTAYMSDIMNGRISKSYLSQMVTGKAAISPTNAVAIEKATNRAVTRKDMRPADWRQIWPEYVEETLNQQSMEG